MIQSAVRNKTSKRRITSKVSEKLIRITQTVKSAMESHAIAARPAECCGLLSGKNDLITGIHHLRNEADKPEARYFASPEDLFAAMKRIRESSQKLIGIYHSHPRSSAYPSVADVQMAFYPDAVYFIISLEPRIEMRAFRIGGNKIDNVDMVIVDE
jgi:proteasome lid subunit RPN8/RPN11